MGSGQGRGILRSKRAGVPAGCVLIPLILILLGATAHIRADCGTARAELKSTGPAKISTSCRSGITGEEWEVIGPVEVLTSCRRGTVEPLFVDPQGFRWALILDPHDPEILNPGTGRFRPASVDWVREALGMVDPRVKSLIPCKVFVLPFPRRGLLRSSCDGTAIYISPGTRPLTREAVHFLVFHEIGHLVHRRMLPDWDGPGWQRYRKVRGIEDPRVFFSGARHADKPHEIFAEDFRLLFGSPAAHSLHAAETSSAPPLGAMPEVRAFFEQLFRHSAGKAFCALP